MCRFFSSAALAQFSELDEIRHSQGAWAQAHVPEDKTKRDLILFILSQDTLSKYDWYIMVWCDMILGDGWRLVQSWEYKFEQLVLQLHP